MGSEWGLNGVSLQISYPARFFHEMADCHMEVAAMLGNGNQDCHVSPETGKIVAKTSDGQRYPCSAGGYKAAAH